MALPTVVLHTSEQDTSPVIGPSTVVLHPIPEAQEKLGGIGRTTLYQLVAQGQLATVHIGRRMFIPSDEISAYIERNRRSGPTDGD